MAEATASLLHRLWYTRMSDVLRGRFDASLDWRRVLADAELPDDLKRVVHDTVRAARLWNSERLDVTRELVAHFQDGLDRGHEAASLVASFGDPAQTARLIRRAKKRGRQPVWKLWHYGWITLSVLLITYVLASVWMAFDSPSIKVDYLEMFRQPALAVPPSERAWPLYRDALLAIGIRGAPGDASWEGKMPDLDSRFGDVAWPELDQFLVVNQAAVAQLREAAARPRLGFAPANAWAGFSPEDRKLFGKSVTPAEVESYRSQTIDDHFIISTLIPDLKQLKTAARLLDADARRALLAGDGKTALADIRAMLGVCRHSQETPFLVALLMAGAVRHMACATIEEAIGRNPQLWSPAELRDLAHLLAATNIDWQRGFKAETAAFQDAMQRFYTDDGAGNGRLAFRGVGGQNIFEQLSEITNSQAEGASALYSRDAIAMFLLPAANMVVASRKDTLEIYRRFTETTLSQIDMPLVEQKAVPIPYPEILSQRVGPIERFRFLFIRLMLPAHRVVLNRLADIEGRRDGVLLGIALELYQREHGKWPESLDELAPRYLPSVPVDRISGKPLGYKVMDDRPIIYSTGIDLDDDGGRFALDQYGQPDYEQASPVRFQVYPTRRIDDGDWIIWTAAKEKSSDQARPVENSAGFGYLHSMRYLHVGCPGVIEMLAA